MIITVTMNPAIDKTVEIDTLHPGGLNRITKVRYDAGGKGINVSKTLRELGCESIATGFLCGSTGRMIEEVLDQKGIRHDFLWGEGETRTNTKVCDRNGRSPDRGRADQTAPGKDRKICGERDVVRSFGKCFFKYG